MVFISTFKRIRGIFPQNQSSRIPSNPQGSTMKTSSNENAASQVTSRAPPTPLKFLDLDGQMLDAETKARILEFYDAVSFGLIHDDKLWMELHTISHQDDNPLLSYRNNRTLLQTACNFHDKSVAHDMVSMILHCPYSMGGENRENIAQLINFQSPNDGLTALHIAARNLNRDTALLLIKAGADVILRSNRGTKPIKMIFDWLPGMLPTIFDAHMKEENPKEGDESWPYSDDFKLRVDYTPVCGIQGPKDVDQAFFQMETSLLFESLRRTEAAKILEHPLTNLFLRDKWERMGSLIKGLAIFQMIWCFLYISFVHQLYNSTCPNVGENSECNPLTTSTSVLGWFLFLASSFFGGKEVLETNILQWRRRHYFCDRPEDFGVWALVFLSIIGMGRLISLEVQSSSLPIQFNSWEYHVANLGIIIAVLLILWQMKKIRVPFVHYYVELVMNKKVWKNIFTGAFLCVHAFIAFYLAYAIMPQRGKLNHDEKVCSFNGTEFSDPFPTIWLEDLFVKVQATIYLTLFGITFGMCRIDCKELLSQPEMVRTMRCRLEQMYLLERLLLSGAIQSRWRNVVEKYIVANEQGFTIKLFKDIPQELRSAIMQKL